MDARNHSLSKDDWALLEYLVDDFVETACFLDRKKTHALKRLLFNQEMDGLHLHEVRGFILNQTLALFGDAALGNVHQVLFVDRSSGRVQIGSRGECVRKTKGQPLASGSARE